MISIYVNSDGQLIYDSCSQCSEIVGVQDGGDILYWKAYLIW